MSAFQIEVGLDDWSAQPLRSKSDFRLGQKYLRLRSTVEAKTNFTEFRKKEYLLFFITHNFSAVIPPYYELSTEQIRPLEVLASPCAVVCVDVGRCSLVHSFLLSVVFLLRMLLSNFAFRTLFISLSLVALSKPFLIAFPCTCQLNRILTNYCKHMKLETRNFFLLLSSQQLPLQITIFLYFVFSGVSFFSSNFWLVCFCFSSVGWLYLPLPFTCARGCWFDTPFSLILDQGVLYLHSQACVYFSNLISVFLFVCLFLSLNTSLYPFLHIK